VNRPLPSSVPARRTVRMALFSLALAGLLALAACSRPDTPSGTARGGANDGPPVNGDWLVRHMLSDPEQLNPLTSNDSGASVVLGNIFETLLDRNPETVALRPLLAAALPEISTDHLTYTFRIRSDARFSDGHPVTAADVLFSVKAIKCAKVNAPFLRVYYESVKDAVLVGDDTIRFTISEPYFLNDSVLGSISVLPRHYYDPKGDLEHVTVRQIATRDPAVDRQVTAFADQFNRNFSRNPMGSGPYIFREWKTGEKVVLDRNPDYWGYQVPEIESPHVDRLLFRIINDTDAALVNLKAGDLDMLGLNPLQHLQQTSGERFTANFTKLKFYSPQYTYLGWNNARPMFRDVKVRRALGMLTDREGMVKSILKGMGMVVVGPIYSFRPEYDKTLQPLPFDPTAAGQLLAEAGWKDTDGDGVLDKELDGKRTPLSFEIKINNGNEVRRSVALAIQDEMRRHGVDARIREVDWTIFLKEVRDHNFDAIILGWSMGVTEPDEYQVWHSSQIADGGSNHISFRNARVDQILETYRREFDPQKRIDMYREFQHILHQEQPYTFLFMGESVLAYSNRFRNVEVLPIGGPVTSRWWVPANLQKYRQEPAEAPAP